MDSFGHFDLSANMVVVGRDSHWHFRYHSPGIPFLAYFLAPKIAHTRRASALASSIANIFASTALYLLSASGTKSKAF